MPLDTLMAESEGVPLRVHRAASGWAQAQVAERLEAATEETAVDQHGLRKGRAKVAGGIAELRLTWERRRRYLVEEPPDPSAPEVCPFRGLAPFDAAQATTATSSGRSFFTSRSSSADRRAKPPGVM